jgi:hypothetical protein
VADRNDDPGVLGNLPRSRPGTRSSKRTAGDAATKRKQPAAGATARRSSTAARKPATSAKPRTRPAAGKAREDAPPRPARNQPADPVTQAVRLAGKVAETGVKTAVGILKRLPGGR